MKAKTKVQAKSVISEMLVVLVAIAMVIGIVVWLRQSHSDSNSNITSEQSCVVVDCHHNNGNGMYVVTVEDRQGNLWDYYCDVPQIKGYVVKVVWRNNEIINVWR